MSVLSVLCIAILTICAASGLFVAYDIGRRAKSYINTRTLLIANYVAIYPISGIVHYITFGGGNRGYFDLVRSSMSDQLMSALMACIGTLFICWGSRGGVPVPGGMDPRMRKEFWLSRGEVGLTMAFIVILLPVSLYALSVVGAYARSLGMERIISLDGGLARYAFLANWLVWAISLIAIVIVATRKEKSEIFSLVVISIAAILIAASLRWSGGRSAILLMAFPLLLTVLPRIRRTRVPALIAGAVCLIVYTTVLTQIRSDSYVRGAGVSYLGWLDWEYGRYSLLGFARLYESRYGFLFGETFLDGFLSTLRGFIQLFGFAPPKWQLIDTSTLATRELSDSSLSFIVPGLGAEAYINFGLFGVAGIFFLLGRLARVIDRRLNKATGVLQYFGYSLLGSVLIFRTISSDSTTAYQFVIYSGLPVIAIALASYFLCRMREPKRRVRYVGNGNRTPLRGSGPPVRAGSVLRSS